jgi:hypothetical protein
MARRTNLSYQGVIEQMTAQLAERRQFRVERHAAYVALAAAILADEPRDIEQLSERDTRAA